MHVARVSVMAGQRQGPTLDDPDDSGNLRWPSGKVVRKSRVRIPA